jgi:hypothetical protein
VPGQRSVPRGRWQVQLASAQSLVIGVSKLAWRYQIHFAFAA